MEKYFWVISLIGIAAVYIAAGIYTYISGRKNKNKNNNEQ